MVQGFDGRRRVRSRPCRYKEPRPDGRVFVWSSGRGGSGASTGPPGSVTALEGPPSLHLGHVEGSTLALASLGGRDGRIVSRSCSRIRRWTARAAAIREPRPAG